MTQTGNGIVAHNVKKIGHLDLPGGGQVVVQGNTAYVGHIDPPDGTSIVDVSDLSRPKVLSTLEVPPETRFVVKGLFLFWLRLSRAGILVVRISSVLLFLRRSRGGVGRVRAHVDAAFPGSF